MHAELRRHRFSHFWDREIDGTVLQSISGSPDSVGVMRGFTLLERGALVGVMDTASKATLSLPQVIFKIH